MRNNPNLHLVNINAYSKFGLIPSIRSEDIEQKWMTIIKGYYSRDNNPNLDLVKVNAYAKFDQFPSICSQDTEWKWNSDNKQGP